MLTLTKLEKSFSTGSGYVHKALDGLSLNVEKGDFITIVGSNGAGKSTLFNAICGDFFVDRGRIALEGKDITYLPAHKRSRIIGRLFQDPLRGSAPNMTIEENLALAYTSGQRQALALVMTTIVVPDVLLLDEHTAALDPVSAETVMRLTNDIVHEHNITTLMITHNLESALHVGNRTIMMDSGKIILDIAGQERQGMTGADIMQHYKNAGAVLSDRTLLTR